MTRPSTRFAALLRTLMNRDAMPRIGGIDARLRSSDDRRFAAAFVAALSGTRSSAADNALNEQSDVAAFFASMVGRARDEIDDVAANDADVLAALAATSVIPEADVAAQDLVWGVTFPEGVAIRGDWVGAVDRLRQRRRVKIRSVAPNPIVDPIRSVLLTANVLVATGEGRQNYWYDHPVPIGTPPDETEIAHGLRALDAAVGLELRRQPEWTGPLAVVLSVSPTGGSDRTAHDYVADVISATGPFVNLRLFLFDETRTSRLLRNLIEPTASIANISVFGVSGPYGRQYSFLKAIAAIWSVCVDRKVRATFKIDLDQSFPQRRLISEAGRSAFEHFTTPEWGSIGVGSDGRELDFGLIAGGLVDSSDIERSLFHPDVDPSQPRTAEDAIFFSRLPQALSTEAEICAQGRDGALERIHVTGGTNGVLIDSLRRWRLFTPSFFGRAEDQAYIVSGLGQGDIRPAYLHVPGLRMRHDKADVISDLLALNENSKQIGDLVRTRLYSSYGSGHKSLLDPFTGAFVSKLPITVTALRLALHALDLPREAATDYLDDGVRRLGAADVLVEGMGEAVSRERREWDVFYDALLEIDTGLAKEDRDVKARVDAVRRVIAAASI